MNFHFLINLLSILYNNFYLFILRILLAPPIHMNIFAFLPKKKNSVRTFNMSNLGRPLSS